MDQRGMIREALISWHDENARQFPWSNQTDPYRVWASEIMLQQTRTESVIPYYLRFLEKYPDVFSLAKAELTDVLKLFEGLGYYTRFRNMLKAAKYVAFERDGVFPEDAMSLKKLPGVGAYAAGAIASIAFSEPAPAIDGNQVRVLSRLFAIDGVPGERKTAGMFTEAALNLLKGGRPGDMNQALMGLGAMVCTPTRPDCNGCCLRKYCAAYEQGLTKVLPKRPEKPVKREETVAVALIFAMEANALRVFIRKRPEGGLLGGMWEFPCFPGARTWEEAAACIRELGIEPEALEKHHGHRHIFTHLIWNMKCYACLSDGAKTSAGLWVSAEALDKYPMSASLKGYRKIAIERMKGL